MDILPPIVAIIFGLALLVWSADRFVIGAAGIAKNLGLSPLIIGITVVGFGTSAPEILISTFAAIDGNPGLALGNAIGSNITNIALVLGVTALIIPLAVHSQTLKREMPILVVAMFFAGFLLLDGALSWLDGLLMLTALILIIGWMIWKAITNPHDTLAAEVHADIPKNMPAKVATAWFIVGLTLLLASSKVLVWGAVEIATMMGISDLIIGLTIIAIGTSLPELAASIASAMKRDTDMAIGNIIGSNLFNILAVMAIPSMITQTDVPGDVLSRDYPFMLGLTVLLVIFSIGIKKAGRVNRFEGGVLLLCFLAYQYWLFTSMETL